MRRFIQAFGKRAAHAMGQHFLVDPRAVEHIIEAADLQPGTPVLEIGPGPGALTAALLEAGARVVAVEKDRRVVAYLQERFPALLSPGAAERLTILEGDALQVDPTPALEALGPGPWRAVGNLPYNVGTGILLRFLEQAPARFDRMVFMFQKEVAMRLVAEPGSRNFGSLSLAVENAAEARIIYTLGPDAFDPPPKVDSAVVTFRARATPQVPAELQATFDAVVRAAFAQRRKTLRNALRGLPEHLDGERALEGAGIDPGRRAETLSLEEFVAMARACCV